MLIHTSCPSTRVRDNDRLIEECRAPGWTRSGYRLSVHTNGVEMEFTKYTLNCSILYGSLPVRDALSRATAAGFTDVEFWWPFTSAAPDDDEVAAFLQAIADFGVGLKGMNLFAGNMAGGDRGVLSWPRREAELHASVAVARRVAEATGCQIFNALYGRRQPSVTAAEQDDLALANLAKAATALSEFGGTVVLEAI